MMRKRITIITACLAAFTAVGAYAVHNRTYSGYDGMALPDRLIEVPDTLIPEDESAIGTDTIGKTHKNEATGLDAMDYLLERRYLNYGDSIRRHWTDHLFIEAGAGVEQMMPAGPGYSFNALTTGHIGVGKQLSRLHSARLTLGGAFGYQQDKDIFFYKFNARLDHLFSLSSYFGGYNPARLMDVSTIAGVGAQYAKLGRGGRSGKAYEAHLGLQFRFFTGPQGYLNVEPYYGIATDGMDLSENRNWRKVDMFYGANINFIYYLNNNLSARARSRFISGRTDGNYVTADSMLQSWRQPWFFEFSNGLCFVNSPVIGTTETLGHAVTVSAGKWLSPVIGLRLSASTTTATWQKNTIPENTSPYRPEYHRYYNSLYFGAHAEALLNPLGFNPNYDWNSRYGLYLVAGMGIGRIAKYQQGRHLACRAESYTAGVHLWTSLSPGLQLFVEPRYTYYSYKIPYSNVSWNKHFSDEGYSVNMGFTVTTRGRRFRRAEGYATADDMLTDRRIVVGLGGGTNLIQTKGGYKGSGGMAYNGLAYGEYHFSPVSSARLSFEYASFARSGMTAYTDYNMTNAADGYSPVSRRGLWDHRFFFGMLALDYQASLTNLCDGYRPGRFFEFSIFAGPALSFVFGETAAISTDEMLIAGHEVRQESPAESGAWFGFNGGVKLAANVTPRLAVVFTPTIYVLGDIDLPGVEMLKIKHFETLNLGVQYKF